MTCAHDWVIAQPCPYCRIADLEAGNAALLLQAQGHAQEARTANATIAEIYQLSTGATGEPGNWNGAEPVRKALGERDALRKALQGIAEDTNTDDDTADYLRHLAKLALKAAAMREGKEKP